MKTINFSMPSLFFLLAMGLVMTSCEKDEASKSSLITDGKWKMTSFTSDPAIDWFGTSVTNVYAQLPSCSKDDLSVFKTDGTVLFDEGASKCEASDPQTRTGKWVMNPAETILTITQDGEIQSWEISTLDKNTFAATYKFTENNTTYNFNITYTRVP